MERVVMGGVGWVGGGGVERLACTNCGEEGQCNEHTAGRGTFQKHQHPDRAFGNVSDVTAGGLFAFECSRNRFVFFHQVQQNAGIHQTSSQKKKNTVRFIPHTMFLTITT